MKQIKMLLLVSTIVLLTACGGGGSSENGSSNATPPGNIENPTETLTLNKALKSYTQSIISIQNQMYEAIGLLSNNYTKVIDANDMTMDEVNAFYDKLKLMEPEIIEAVWLEYQISELSKNITQEESANIAIQYKSVIPETGIVITGGAIVAGVLALYAGYEVYAHGVESKKKLYDSADNLINSAEDGSELQNYLKEVLELPKNATKGEMRLYYSLLEGRKKESFGRKMLRGVEADSRFVGTVGENAVQDFKNKVVEVAKEGAGAAFKATAAGTAAGAGAIVTSAPAASNLQSALPYTSIPDTSAKVTLSLTAAETTSAGVGAALGSVAVVVKSREKEEKQILKPKITMTKEQALEKLREMKNGAIEGLGIDGIIDAVRTVLREMAKNNGEKVNEDGTSTIKIPKRFQIIIVEKEHVGKDIKMQKIEKSDIVIVSEKTKPVMVSNVDPSEGQIAIEIPNNAGNTEVLNPEESNTKEWVYLPDLSRWWQTEGELGYGGDEDIFFWERSIFMREGTSSYGVYSNYFDSNFDLQTAIFDTEHKWSVPPQKLASGTSYPMNASITRTKGTDIFYRESEIKIIIDDYEEYDKSCFTSGEFAKNITTKVVYVTSNPSDLSTNSWEGEFTTPNPGEYNNKFQIEIRYPGGCCRYVYKMNE